MTTTITRKYKTNIGVFGRKASRKAISKYSAQYPNTNIKLTNSQIIMKEVEGFSRPTEIKIKANSGKHKAVVTQEITRTADHNNYAATLDNALGKIYKHFDTQEKTLANTGKKNKFPVFTFLHKIFSRPVKL